MRRNKTAYAIWMKFCTLVGSRRNHLCEFWWRSVNGFGGGGEGQILLFCLYIRRHPYKHFTTLLMSVDVTVTLNICCENVEQLWHSTSRS